MRERASSLKRTLSVKRVFSRRSLANGSTHVRLLIHTIQISRIPVRNTTVFVHWSVPTLNLEGDLKRTIVNSDTSSAKWSGETITIDTILDDNQELNVHFTLHEDVVTRIGRSAAWKQYGTGSFNIAVMKKNETNQLMIIPLLNGKKNTCMLEMHIDHISPTITDIFKNMAKPIVCCDDSFLIGAFYECPLEWPLGVERISERWPRIKDRLAQALEKTASLRTDESHVYWYSVLRALGCERSDEVLRDAMRRLRDIGVESINSRRSNLYSFMLQFQWSEDDQTEWACNVARKMASDVMDPLIEEREVAPGSKDRLEDLCDWLRCYGNIADARNLLEVALDRLD